MAFNKSELIFRIFLRSGVEITCISVYSLVLFIPVISQSKIRGVKYAALPVISLLVTQYALFSSLFPAYLNKFKLIDKYESFSILTKVNPIILNFNECAF